MVGVQAILVLLKTVILTRMFSLCLGSSLVNQNGEIPLVGRLYFNRFLPESELTRVYGRSFDQCRGECDARQSCKSVNYNRLVHSCVLNDADLDGSSHIAVDPETVSLPGFSSAANNRKRRAVVPLAIVLELQEKMNCVYSQKSDWQKEGRESRCLDACDDGRQKCTESGNGVTCGFAECVPIPETPENGVVLGNRNVKESKLKLKCNTGYNVSGNDTCTCQPTGQWTPIGSCISRCPEGEWVFYRTRCYRYRNELTTKTQAKELCAGDNSHLVIVEDKSENDFIEKLIMDKHAVTVWFGAHMDDSGTFVWEDGSDATFRDWHPGQPTFESDQTCIATHAYHPGDYNWHDIGCYLLHNFVCERAAV